MLRSLSVENFAVTKVAHLDFSGGFCALTGETGAGKSMMVDALAMALGARSDSSWVRQNCDKATVSAVFDASSKAREWLDARGIDCLDGEVCLRRVMEAQGRSKAWINGVSVSAGESREIGALLAAIHGQHESVALLGSKAQREHVDAYAKNASLLSSVALAHEAWAIARERSREAASRAQTLDQERAKLAWELDEIGRVDPKEGEWEELERLQAQLSQAAEIGEACEMSMSELTDGDGSISSRLSKIARALGALPSAKLREAGASLEQALELVSDVSRDISRFGEAEDLSSSRMAKIDSRLGEIHGLSRKLRVAPAELRSRGLEARSKLARIEDGLDAAKLAERESGAMRELETVCAALTASRKGAGEKLAKAATSNLSKLGMAKSRVSIEMSSKPPGPDGADLIEIVMSGHEGAKALPISKSASGGELARIGLALCAASLEQDQPGCMVFDEVDAGIGGPTGLKVGQMLSQIGAKGQALAVTHLPQVAAVADMHYAVGKRDSEDGPQSVVRQVSGAEREREIARMLGDEDSGSALEHAKALLAAPASWRS